jgi:hypothetical protein
MNTNIMNIKIYNSSTNEIISFEKAIDENLISVSGNTIKCKISSDKVLRGLGICDSDGVEVFEGDYVSKCKSGWSWYVEYAYFGDACFYVSNGINSGRVIECDQDNWFSADGEDKYVLKVSGNINFKKQ